MTSIPKTGADGLPYAPAGTGYTPCALCGKHIAGTVAHFGAEDTWRPAHAACIERFRAGWPSSAPDRYPVQPEQLTTWDALPYFVQVKGTAHPDPTLYRVFTKTPEQAIAQVAARRGRPDLVPLDVHMSWDETTETLGITLCPLCGEPMQVAVEYDEPYCEWCHCANPACPAVRASYHGLGFTVTLSGPRVVEYYAAGSNEPEQPGIFAHDGYCLTCGKHSEVMNTSCSSPNCVNPECQAYLGPEDAGVDRDDFTMSCVDPAEWPGFVLDQEPTTSDPQPGEYPECFTCQEKDAGCIGNSNVHCEVPYRYGCGLASW